MKPALASLALASHLVFSGVAADAWSGDAAVELDARLQAFARQIRCLVCQNETLAESQADLAADLRREIRAQMEAGRSDEQITAFLTERYGDFVLYRPPLKPGTYLLWLGPFVLLGVGLVALYRSVKLLSMRPGVRPLTPGEQKRARQLLDAQHRVETV